MLLDNNIKPPKLYYGSEHIEIPYGEYSLTIDETPTSEPPFKAEMATLTFDVTIPHIKEHIFRKVTSNWNVTTKRLPRKKKKMLKKILSKITGVKSNKIYIHYAYKWA